jgi:hypothetical protein
MIQTKENKMNPCIACPFRDGENEIATQAQNYGCLPTKHEMIETFDSTGVALSCHDNDKVCKGLASVRDVSSANVKTHKEWYNNEKSLP